MIFIMILTHVDNSKKDKICMEGDKIASLIFNGSTFFIVIIIF